MTNDLTANVACVQSMSKSPSVRLFSREGIASIGFYILISGITLTSIVWGAQSGPYYAVLAVGFVLALPLFQQAFVYRRRVIVSLLLLAFFPLFLYSMQNAFLSPPEFEAPSLLFTLAISATITFSMLIALLSEVYFRWTMHQVAWAHLAICGYGLMHSNMILLQAEQHRLSALGVHTAVWAELAIGMVAAAVLSARPLVVGLTTIVGGLIIFKAQMRGAGLSLFLLFVIYSLLSARGTQYFRSIVLISTVVSVIALAVSFDAIVDIVRAVLLLDDPQRGINSGFSGRFENWEAGFSRYMASPLIGVGTNDSFAGYVHNGYLKVLAQFGSLFFLVILGCLILGARRAWRDQRIELLSVIGSYSFFLVSAPRYINLQIMPFLGLVAVAVALIDASKRGRSRF